MNQPGEGMGNQEVARVRYNVALPKVKLPTFHGENLIRDI
jgi:hypothetical protein